MTEKKKLILQESDDFFREISTDVAISGPTSDGLFHLTFLCDAIDIHSQTMNKVRGSEADYSLHFSTDDTEAVRIKLGRCSLPSRAYFGILGAIIERAKNQGDTDKIIEILASKGILINDNGVADEK